MRAFVIFSEGMWWRWNVCIIFDQVSSETPVPMDENIESTHPFPEDFEGPGSINEVLIPYYLCLLNYS